MKRRTFVQQSSLAALASCLPWQSMLSCGNDPELSSFEKRLSPVGRALDIDVIWDGFDIEKNFVHAVPWPI